MSSKRLYELNKQLLGSPCMEIMNRIYKFDQSVKIFLSNVRDLENAVQTHVNTPYPDVRDRKGRVDLNEQLFDIVRHLHNSVAAAMSLVNHTRVFYNEYYRDSRQIPDYNHRIQTSFVENGVIQFVKSLRQFCQHYRSPMTVTSVHFDNQRGRHWRSVGLLKADLIEFSGWSSIARRYLEELPDTIDFMEIVQNYEGSIIKFYDWFFGCLRSIHAEDIEFYNSMSAEIERLTALDYQSLPLRFPGADAEPGHGK